MEIIKKDCHMNYFKKQIVSQLTIDEDFNVPDVKGDIEKYLTCDTLVHIESVKSSEGRVNIRGQIEFKLLYVSGEGQICGMENQIPFDEVVNVDEIKSSDTINLRYYLEDFNIGIINTRKINVRGILTFTICPQQSAQIEAVSGMEGDETVNCRHRKENFLQSMVNKKDTYRVREDIELSSEKPNIEEILWSTLTLNNIVTRIDEDRIGITGELRVFFMYLTEGENTPVQWMWASIPFDGSVDVPGCEEDMIGDIDTVISGYTLNIKPDYDGEQRMVELEAVLELAMNIYREEEVEILEDAYSLKHEIRPVMENAQYSCLGMKNVSRCKVSDKLRLNKEYGHVMQILSTQGNVAVEDTYIEEKGIRVEGMVKMKIMYVTSDDSMPLGIADEIVPFTHLIEAEGMQSQSMSFIRPSLEQIQASMSGNNEIEMKCQVVLDTLVVEKRSHAYIADAQCEPVDLKRIQKIPGMAGYVVRDKDTLWDIAKKYCTTVPEIMRMNDLKTEEIKKGEMLIITKTFMG